MADGPEIPHKHPFEDMGNVKTLTLYAGLSDNGVPMHVTAGVKGESHPFFAVHYGAVNGPRVHKEICVYEGENTVQVRIPTETVRNYEEPWHSGELSPGNHVLTQESIDEVLALVERFKGDVETGIAETLEKWSRFDLQRLKIFFLSEFGERLDVDDSIRAAGTDKITHVDCVAVSEDVPSEVKAMPNLSGIAGGNGQAAVVARELVISETAD